MLTLDIFTPASKENLSRTHAQERSAPLLMLTATQCTLRIRSAGSAPSGTLHFSLLLSLIHITRGGGRRGYDRQRSDSRGGRRPQRRRAEPGSSVVFSKHQVSGSVML
jgi:hypothetical protein